MENEKKGAASKLSEIFNGWKNVVFPNEHVEMIAKARGMAEKERLQKSLVELWESKK